MTALSSVGLPVTGFTFHTSFFEFFCTKYSRLVFRKTLGWPKLTEESNLNFRTSLLLSEREERKKRRREEKEKKVTRAGFEPTAAAPSQPTRRDVSRSD